MKAIIIISSILLFSVFIIHGFTTVNLSFSKLNPNNIPDLSQKLNNNSYVIEKISNKQYADIRYDSLNNFYLIANNDTIIRLNKNGEETFKLNLDERDMDDNQDGMEYYKPSYFVISWYGIYDLSKEMPYLEKFDKKYNDRAQLSWDEWNKLFKTLYETSDVVLWGNRKTLEGLKVHPLYFRQNGKWKILYTAKNEGHMVSNETYNTFRLDFTKEEETIPDKSHKLYLLKDIQNENTYSDFNNSNNNSDSTYYVENKMSYSTSATVKTVSFRKEDYDEIPYSIIPLEFAGPAINKLEVGNSHIIFKSNALKDVGLTNEVRTYIYLFEVPTKFKTESSLIFLHYKYPTSWNSDENSGIYVIKKIKK